MKDKVDMSRKNYNRAKQPSVKFDPLSVMRCFNCDDPSPTIRKCLTPVNAVRAAQRKLEYYAKKKAGRPVAYVVLFELCQQVDTQKIDLHENIVLLTEDGKLRELNAEEELFNSVIEGSSDFEKSPKEVSDCDEYADFPSSFPQRD